MYVALSQSKRLLILALALLTLVTGLSLTQLLNSAAANAATSAAAVAAGEPKAGVSCDEGYGACSGTISTSGGSAPNTGGTVTTPGGSTSGSNGFSFLLPCRYHIQDSVGQAYGIDLKYPINAKNASEAGAICEETNPNQTVTQRKQPASGDNNVRGTPGQCDPIQIDGQWTAAIGTINYSTAGWTKVANSNPTKWNIKFKFSCVYPSKSAKTFAREWTRYCLMNNNEWRLFYTKNASTAKADGSGFGGGTQIDKRTGVDPNPAFKASDAKDCKQNLEDTWQTYKLPQANDTDGYKGPKYGFYRFSIHGFQIYCTGQDPVKWTNNKPTSTCDPATKKPIYAHTNYTYTCNSTGFQNTAPDQSDAKYFTPSGCVNYTCDIDATKIAKQSPSTEVTVLRNGEQTNTRIGNFTVGGKGLVKGSVTNKQVKLNVVAKSSPDNPDVGSNSNDEWFKMMNQVTGSRISFGEWQSLASNSDPLKAGLIFYWASDPDKHWQMRQSYQFDAKYNVWRQDRIGSNPYLDAIADPDAPCDDTTTSSEVVAVRSISQVSN